eukprot:IDg15104t1
MASDVPSGITSYNKLYIQSTDGVLRLGDEVPNFRAQTTEGEIVFHDWLDSKWAILFSHPDDFTPVCTTEIGRMALKYDSLKAKGVKVCALSCNNIDSHKEWLTDVVAHFFVIGPDRKLKLSINYPSSVGRNFDEIERVVDALILSYDKSVATPANWPNNHKGKEHEGWVFLLPTVTDDDAKKHFPEHKELDMPSGKSYMRLTPNDNICGVDVLTLKVGLSHRTSRCFTYPIKNAYFTQNRLLG